MKQYHDLCRHILENGVRKEDRTGTGTLSTFGYQMRFDLSKGFPMITTKKLHWPSIAHELLWFLSGDTNTKYLTDNGVRIWNEWADEDGNLGPVYGKQWRSWDCTYFTETESWDLYDTGIRFKQIDQIANVIDQIKTNPDSRRLMVNAWNVGELDEMALPPCHFAFQFYVTPPSSEGANGKLSCQLYQRSGDVFLGIPFNIASYALLTHMIAHVTGLEAGEFVHTIGDAHIYTNHIEQVETQLKRDFKPLPQLRIKRQVTDIDDFTFDDFEIVGYEAHPHIKGKVAI